MTTNKIKKEIEQIEKAIFIEHMADFLDWNAVRSLEKEKAKLEATLEKAEKPQSEYNKRLEKQLAEQEQRHINALVAGILED